MHDDGELRWAISGLLAGLLLVGGAIGLFLVFAGVADNESAPRQGNRVPELLGSRQSPQPPKCADLDTCLEPSRSLQERYRDPTSCTWDGLRICIVPLGDVPLDLIEQLVEYYVAEYRLGVRVLPPLTLAPGLDEERAGQVEASELRRYFLDAYPGYDQDPQAILIGLTPVDVYSAQRPEWNWIFGAPFRFPGAERPRQAVISIYRMDPVSWGEAADDDLRDRRVRTMMNKYVALSYYGMALNDDPSSVLYGQIGGLGDLDRIDERIPIER